GAGDQVELVVAPAADPAIEHVAVQPGAPALLRRHAGVHAGRGDADDAEGQRQEDERLPQYGAPVLVVEGVEQRPVPDVEPVLEREVHEGEDHDEGAQYPGSRSRTPAPEAEGRVPVAREEISPGVALALLRHRPPPQPPAILVEQVRGGHPPSSARVATPDVPAGRIARPRRTYSAPRGRGGPR